METTITQFSKQSLAVLRTEIQAALDHIKSKYGLSDLWLESTTFSTTSFTSKISGKIQNSESADFEKNEAKFFAMRHGLPENLIGSEFILDGDIFTITKINIKRPKYPIIAHCKKNNITFKFTVQRIKELLDGFRVINIPYTEVK